MFKSIGLATVAALAVVSFVPPTASAQDRSSNRWNGSYSASSQTGNDYGNRSGTAYGSFSGNKDNRGFNQPRGTRDGYNNGYSAENRGFQNSFGYDSATNRQSATNGFRDRQPASHLRYGGPANDRSRERGGRNFRNDRDWDDYGFELALGAETCTESRARP
jgi:hypothetical protein